MVVPWIWYSIWKFWVIYVLVSLVFHVFSTAELISPCKTVNLAVWAFSSNFLHDFTLYGIDMNYIYHISSIATIFGPLSKVTILGHKCMAILGIRLNGDDDVTHCVNQHMQLVLRLVTMLSSQKQRFSSQLLRQSKIYRNCKMQI